MIGRLRGTLLSRQPPWLLVEVGGVGYELEAPMSTIYDLPAVGQEVVLLTHYSVKEDSVALYGFASETERVWFRQLLKVSGVGAKIALAVLSGMSPDALARTLHAGDPVPLTKIPGIGKKTAERIVVELRDRVDAPAAGVLGAAAVQALPHDARGEAEVALQQLGYKPAEAARLVAKAAAEGDNAETIIRKSLRAALGG
ncbi:MAG TPA: Holliday junction branch migration protein RuvA [Rhodanobacteraceae bacterium]